MLGLQAHRAICGTRFGQGVAFGNRVWADDRIPRTHHDERDYARLAALGMNAVRFYLNYQTFEDDDGDRAKVAVVSESFARRFLDGRPAVGRRIGHEVPVPVVVVPRPTHQEGEGA